MGKVDKVIRNGKIVTPTRVITGGLAIKGGKIVAIGSEEFLPQADEYVDAGGKYVIPGLVDPETHLGIHRGLIDDLISETRAALASGVTTWGMQLTSPNIRKVYKKEKSPEDVRPYAEVFPVFKELGEEYSVIDFFFTPIIMNDEQAAEIPLLAKQYGVTSYKLYLHMKKGAETFGAWEPQKKLGFYGFDEGTVYLTLENAAKIGKPGIVSLHCENWEIGRIYEQRLKAAGRKDMGAWDARSPHFCEAGHVREYSYYAKVTGCPIYIQHVTTPETIAEIKKAKADGVEIYGQSGSHYLYLPEDTWKLNVPLRDKASREALWQGLKDGDIDCLGSDHVNHGVTRSEMEVPGDVWATISGFSSRVEALLPVVLSEGVNKGRFDLQKAVQVLCENPARIFGLFPKKGAITVGSDADLVVLDMDRELTVNKDMIGTSAGWSILEGHTFKGWPIMVFRNGQKVMDWQQGKKAQLFDGPKAQYIGRRLGEKFLYD